jgi:hypothetical protein
MITRDAAEFLTAARTLPADLQATANAVLLVRPTGFRLSGETATDNAYMQPELATDAARALAEHRALETAIAERARLPVAVFDGDPSTPDAVFPNNVFANTPGRLLIGAMRHPERQRESRRTDIPAWYSERGCSVERLDQEPGVVAELTGSLVIDRARGIGFCGLTERCNAAGAEAMHRAFGLRASLMFDLTPGEYHTNVVLAVLAGRAAILHRAAIAQPAAADAIFALYGDGAIAIDGAEKEAFVGNSISLRPDQVWMSATAERGLTAATRERLRALGFALHSVEMPEIEKAGGSLRCCVAEVY